MQQDKAGFDYPITDMSLCTDCDLCNKICPVQNKVALHDGKCYAAASNKEKIRAKSSSGGIFAHLARQILEERGIVCAVRMDGRVVKHDMLLSMDDLPLYLGSKYVQSQLGDNFPRIKAYLKEKRKVLFVGTPCQVAGLRKYLKRDDKNLILIDVLCHATPSPLAWEKYLAEQFGDEEILSVNFRAKHHGWASYGLEIKTNKRVFFEVIWENAFLQAFLAETINRPCCSVCDYCTTKRVGDITLGDFWGIKHYNAAFDDQKGCSLILCNTARGEDMFQQLSEYLQLKEPVPIDQAIQNNAALRSPQVAHANRDHFLRLLQSPYASFTRSFISINSSMTDLAILSSNWWKDYGRALSTYATQQFIYDLGFSSKIIDYQPSRLQNSNQNVFNRFAKQYLLKSPIVDSDKSLRELNNSFHQFLVGPDTVWDSAVLQQAHYAYFLDFVHDEKAKIAYGINFDRSLVGTAPALRYNMEQLSQRFDEVYAATGKGVTSCQNELKRPCILAPDPVFMVDKKLWHNLAEQSTRTLPANSIVIVDTNQGKQLRRRVEEQYRHDNIIEAHIHQDEAAGVQDWLKSIKDATLIVTDSFYGICFAIIFNKAFVCLFNIHESLTKITSLLADLNQTARGVMHWEELDKTLITQSPYHVSEHEDFLRNYKGESSALLHATLCKQPSSSIPSISSIKKVDNRRRRKAQFILKRLFYLAQILVKRKNVAPHFVQRFKESNIKLR